MNINDLVWVHLTDEGKSIYNERSTANERRHGFAFRRSPDHGWARFQLWCFMEIYGPHLHNGGPTFITNNEIYFTTPEAAEGRAVDL